MTYSKFLSSGQQGSEDKYGRSTFKDHAANSVDSESETDSIIGETNNKKPKFSAFSCNSKKLGQNILDYMHVLCMYQPTLLTYVVRTLPNGMDASEGGQKKRVRNRKTTHQL